MPPSNRGILDLEKGSIELQETLAAAVDPHAPTRLSPEQYERLSFASTALPRKFGNPTPLGLIAFALVQAPSAFVQMRWGGSTLASETVFVGPYFLLGGLLLVVSGVMEWIIGDTFACVVNMTFGGNWLALAVILDPAHGIASAFPDGSNSPDYNRAFMFYYAIWTFLTSVYFVASLTRNVASAGIFFTITFANALSAAAYGELSNGNETLATALVKGAGAFEFVVLCFTCYLFVALMFDSVDMPFKLPVGDLSKVFAKKRKLS